jgi:hypothetical protein
MSEENIGEDVQLVEGDSPKNMQVAVIGDNALARATWSAFVVPRGIDAYIYPADRIDDCLESKPNVVFWCDPIGVKKNDTMDDGEFMASIQKLVRAVGAGVCVRSTITIETYERLLMALTPDIFNKKIVYMPDLTDSSEERTILNSCVTLVGADSGTLTQHLDLLRNMSWFNTSEIRSGTVPEVIYAKLATTGMRLVKQKFYDELFNAVMDLKNANPMVVSQLIGNTVVPSHVSEGDLFDGRIFAGATESLTLIDACLGD